MTRDQLYYSKQEGIENKQLRKLFKKWAKLMDKVNKLEATMLLIQDCCTHISKETHSGLSGHCIFCGKHTGWYCPKSSNHICDYNQKNGKYNPDICIYCGNPSERK